MFRSQEIRILSIGLATLLWVPPLKAAPAPRPPALNALVKYIPDDAYCLMVVNVKEMVTDMIPRRKIAKEVERTLLTGILTEELVQPPWFKECGFKPLQDVEHVVVIRAPKAGSRGDGVGGSPIGLIQGRFDPDKFKAKADQFIREKASELKIRSMKLGDVLISEVPNFGVHFYYCLVDSTTMVVTVEKSRIEEAIKNSVDDKRTKLKNPRFSKLFEEMNPPAAINILALEDMVIGKEETSEIKFGQRIELSKVKTIGDYGIEALQCTVSIGDDLKAKVHVMTKGADKAKEFAEASQKRIAQAIRLTKKNLESCRPKDVEDLDEEERKGLKEKEEEQKQLYQFLTSIEASAKDEILSFETQGDPETLWLGVISTLTWLIQDEFLFNGGIP
jgi:hypothetical protein